MARFRRRILIGAVALFGVALLAGAFFQFSTGKILERAEALQFRRMLVTRQGDEGAFRFFYVTNRREVRPDGELDERFENQREAGLRFGFFDTAIEPSLGIGMLVNPTDWFQNEEIRLRDVRGLERSAFIEKLRAQVGESPYRSLLINVNGFRERFPSALRKTAFVGHILDINSPVLLFDWPGDQGTSPRAYRHARRVAKASGAELAATLELVIREIQPDRLWLVANSMGAQVVVDALSLLYQESDLADADTEIEDVLLTAPDVDHDEFDQRFKQEIKALANHLIPTVIN